MSKNLGKGGKSRKKGKRSTRVTEQSKRDLVLREEEGQVYAQVSKMFGNLRLEASCFDGINRVCHIRGTFVKKVWICAGDVILVDVRTFEPDKGDVVYKFTADEVRTLKTLGEIPDVNMNLMGEGEEEENIPYEFRVGKYILPISFFEKKRINYFLFSRFGKSLKK